MANPLNETELDVIYRVLDEEHVSDAERIAQRIHSAQIKRRLIMLTADLKYRVKEGLM